MKAILPSAGRGSRLKPLTDCLPKALIPVGSRLTIQHVVGELSANGILDVGVTLAVERNWTHELAETAIRSEGAAPHLISDLSFSGPVAGILKLQDWISNDDAVVAFPDCLIVDSGRNKFGISEPLRRLIRVHQEHGNDCTFLCEHIPNARQEIRDGTLSYFDPAAIAVGEAPEGATLGIVAENPDNWDVDRSVNLTESGTVRIRPDRAGSVLVPAARWIIRPVVWRFLKELRPRGREAILSDVVYPLVRAGAKVGGVFLTEDERRLDIGTWDRMYQAWAYASKSHKY